MHQKAKPNSPQKQGIRNQGLQELDAMPRMLLSLWANNSNHRDPLENAQPDDETKDSISSMDELTPLQATRSAPLEGAASMSDTELSELWFQHKYDEKELLKFQFNEQLLSLTKNYSHPQYDSPDSRRYIGFKVQQLHALLDLYANLHPLYAKASSSANSTAPFYGYSEECFRQLLVYVIQESKSRAFISDTITSRGLQFSLLGKTIIRNLLHTASTFRNGAGKVVDYTTNPEVKSCYIRLFKEACELFVSLRDERQQELELQRRLP